MSPLFTDGKEARRGNDLPRSHKPVHGGAGDEVRESGGSLSGCGKGGYRGGAQWLSKKNEVLIRPMRIGPLHGTVPANGA